MNAAEFLASRGRTISTHPVTVRLLDPSDPTKMADAPAVFRLVPERLRLAALDKAAESLSALKSAASDNRRIAEEAYHLLVEAVRQESAPAAPFFETVVQAKSMLLETEAVRLLAEYQRYTDAHFPASLSDEEIGKLAEAARGHFLPDLLTSYGYWPILRALPSLAAIFGAPLTASSSPTPSPST